MTDRNQGPHARDASPDASRRKHRRIVESPRAATRSLDHPPGSSVQSRVDELQQLWAAESANCSLLFGLRPEASRCRRSSVPAHRGAGRSRRAPVVPERAHSGDEPPQTAARFARRSVRALWCRQSTRDAVLPHVRFADGRRCATTTGGAACSAYTDQLSALSFVTRCWRFVLRRVRDVRDRHVRDGEQRRCTITRRAGRCATVRTAAGCCTTAGRRADRKPRSVRRACSERLAVRRPAARRSVAVRSASAGGARCDARRRASRAAADGVAGPTSAAAADRAGRSIRTATRPKRAPHR